MRSEEMIDESPDTQTSEKSQQNDRNGEKEVPTARVRGVLAQHADPVLREKEEGAWERAAAEKYGKS